MDKTAFLERIVWLQQDYEPSPPVRRRLRDLELIATVGPTAAGKSTLMRQSGLPYVMSDVTRSKRPGEFDGLTYNFRSDYKELLKEVEAGEFVQFTIGQAGEFYGTKISSYPRSGLFTMSVLARLVSSFKNYGFKLVRPVFIVPPDYSEWIERISEHHEINLEPRFKEAIQSLETALRDDGYLYVLNKNIDDAVEQFLLVTSGTIDPDSQVHARQAAESLLSDLRRAWPTV